MVMEVAGETPAVAKMTAVETVVAGWLSEGLEAFGRLQGEFGHAGNL